MPYYQLLIHTANPSLRDMIDIVDLEPMVHEFLQTRAGDDGLYVAYAVQKVVLPIGIQLRKNIVQQQYGRIFGDLLHQLYLRQLQRKRGRSLLALRPVSPDVHISYCKRKIVSMRTYRRYL